METMTVIRPELMLIPLWEYDDLEPPAPFPRRGSKVDHWLMDEVFSVRKDACAEWPYALDSKAQMPVIQWEGKRYNASHVVLTLGGQPRPDDSYQVLHSCDNELCLCLLHVRWGTAAENAAERIMRKRQTRGEDVAVGKLTAELVRQMRDRHSSGQSASSLARDFDVSPQAVSAVIHRRVWRHVP